MRRSSRADRPRIVGSSRGHRCIDADGGIVVWAAIVAVWVAAVLAVGQGWWLATRRPDDWMERAVDADRELTKDLRAQWMEGKLTLSQFEGLVDHRLRRWEVTADGVQLIAEHRDLDDDVLCAAEPADGDRVDPGGMEFGGMCCFVAGHEGLHSWQAPDDATSEQERRDARLVGSSACRCI